MIYDIPANAVDNIYMSVSLDKYRDKRKALIKLIKRSQQLLKPGMQTWKPELTFDV